MTDTCCPFCQKTFTKSSADTFEACPQCGFRSARVDAGDNSYLIIDSRLPNLMEVYTSLQKRESGSVILIDRRIGQKPIAGAERRR
jgi:Zn-finger nucleic acid-binding protein